MLGPATVVTAALLFVLAGPATAQTGPAAPPAGGQGHVEFRCPPAAVPTGHAAWPIERDLGPHRDEPVVPVVILMMPNRGCATKSACHDRCASDTPTCQWTPEKVEQQFGPSGRVNAIWRAHGLRLAVVAVRECAYDPARFHQGSSIGPGTPPTTEAEWRVERGPGQRYDKFNHEFGVDDALNVFLWIRVENDTVPEINYFGSSPRHPLAAPPKRAIVWADTFCVWEDPNRPEDQQLFTPATCARKLAHEVGHALTLRHVTDPGAQGSANWNEFAACHGLSTTTAGAVEHNLMRESATIDRANIQQFEQLTEWQRCQATSAAAAFFKPSRFASP